MDIWVAGKHFTQDLKLRVSSSDLKTGEVAFITAERFTSGWHNQKKRFWNFKNYWKSKPPEYEADVSLNISYEVVPHSNVEFGVSETGCRTIRFLEQGEFLLFGRSSLWKKPGIKSEPVKIVVR